MSDNQIKSHIFGISLLGRYRGWRPETTKKHIYTFTLRRRNKKSSTCHSPSLDHIDLFYGGYAICLLCIMIRVTLYMMTSSMEAFSALLAFSAGNLPVPGEFPSQRPVTQSFDVLFDLCLNKRGKQSWGWWFETTSQSLWCHCDVSKRHCSNTNVM